VRYDSRVDLADAQIHRPRWQKLESFASPRAIVVIFFSPREQVAELHEDSSDGGARLRRKSNVEKRTDVLAERRGPDQLDVAGKVQVPRLLLTVRGQVNNVLTQGEHRDRRNAGQG
jgi:hypothetical protein